MMMVNGCDDLVKLIYASAVPSLWLGILVFCHLAQWLSYMNAPINVTVTVTAKVLLELICNNNKFIHPIILRYGVLHAI